MDIADLRQTYRRATLDERDLDIDPFLQFGRWLDQAIEAQATILPSAKYGLPTTADLDKYLAFHKLLEQMRNTVQNAEETEPLLAKNLYDRPYAKFFAWNDFETEQNHFPTDPGLLSRVKAVADQVIVEIARLANGPSGEASDAGLVPESR